MPIPKPISESELKKIIAKEQEAKQEVKKTELPQIKIGSMPKLKWIPIDQLVNPWYVCVSSRVTHEPRGSIESIAMCNSRSLNTMKRDDLEALKRLIMKYGLLNPLIVAKHPENPEMYVIVDGQRRYFALMELLKVSPFDKTVYPEYMTIGTKGKPRVQPFFKWDLENKISKDELKKWKKKWFEGHITRDQEEKRKGSWCAIVFGSKEALMQAYEREFEEYKECLERQVYKRVSVPCLVYPYKTWEQMRRHSVEDNKFSVRPATSYLDLAERI